MRLSEDFLHFDYDEDEKIYDEKRFFEEEGNEPFDKCSKKQMLIMMSHLSTLLDLDAYALKRLEVLLHMDLPFFAVTRRLVLNWVKENFLA